MEFLSTKIMIDGRFGQQRSMDKLPNFTSASPGILKVKNGHCTAAMSGLRTAETTSNCTGQGKWSFNPLSVHDHAALNVWNAKSGLSVQNVPIDQWSPTQYTQTQWCQVSPGQSSRYTGGGTIPPGLSIRAPGPATLTHVTHAENHIIYFIRNDADVWSHDINVNVQFVIYILYNRNLSTHIRGFCWI